MAFRTKTIPLFKNQSISPGGAATSNIIDLREDWEQGSLSLSFSSIAGTASTAGTTIFSYTGCSISDGTFITPSAAVAIGTCGTAITADIMSMSPPLMPFMRVIATQTGVGGTGKDSKITAELNVR
jgi:hypothetical protein